MYFSLAVDAGEYAHQSSMGSFWGFVCAFPPPKYQNWRLAAFFVVKTFTKIITVGRAEGAAKFPVLAPLRCSTSRVCTAAALAPPLLRVCKYSPRHMRTLAIEYVSTGSVLTCALTSTEVSVGK